MTDSWFRRRPKALSAVEALSRLLADPEVDERRLVSGYIEAKRELAAAFEAKASEAYSGPSRMDTLRGEIELEMRRLYPDLPHKYLRVKGFARIHERILNYLAARLGQEVAADELRILSGDAVHTERRARELRDLGLELVTREAGGVATYRLVSLTADAGSAAANLVAKNIRDDAKLGAAGKEELLRQLMNPPSGW